MKIVSCEGIIISETNYGESSKILNVFTYDYGLIGIMSKGCCKMKSKLRGVSRKLIYGKIHFYYKENGLSTLIGIDVINSFNNTILDLKRISYASFILDLIYQVIKQNEDKELFILLKDTLIKIEEGLDPLILTNILEIKLLDYLGVSPNVDCCNICGSNKNIVSLDCDAGGYVCKECITNELIVNEKIIKMIRMFYYVDISKISKLNVSSDVTRTINLFLDNYYDKYTGLYIKSKEFLKNVVLLDNV